MSELHKTTVYEKDNSHSSFVGSNKSVSVANKVLSDCSLKALIELSDVLKPIYSRMRKEGYGMIEGRLVKQNENE
jgi:hypothetical protein